MEGGKDFGDTGTGAGQVDTGDHNGVNESNTSFQTPFNLPPGFRFCPKDDELINHYLIQKILNRPLPYIINEVNLYDYNPQDLSEKFKPSGEKEWYFFTPRDKKYRNGSRPNRAAGDGYWKATGADKPIITKQNGIAKPIGVRKALVFYKGKPPKGDKTNWIMHEYRLNESKDNRKKYSNSMRLDDWVLCRIYKKPNNDKSPKGPGNEHSDTVNSTRSIEELPYASKINTSDIFDTTMLPTLIDPVGLHFPNDYSLPTYNSWFSSGYPSHPCDSNLSDPSTCDIFNNHYRNAEYGQVDQYLPIESNASDTSTYAMMMNKYGPMPQTMNMKEELNTAPLIDTYSRNILGQYDASGYQDEVKGSNQRKEKQKISPAKHQEVLLKCHYN